MKPGNKELIDFDKQHIWHPFTSLEESSSPVFVKSGQGVYLYTDDGRKIIDGISSWWVNIHGHSNPHIAEAIYRQALNLEHVIFAGFTHDPAIQLTRNLLSILPSSMSRVFFSDNGSTSVEVALKMAMQFWYNNNIKKHKVIAFEGAYHGDTFGSMSVGGRSAFTNAFEPYLFDVQFIEVPTTANFETVVQHFRELVATGEVAAFIFEPLVQGAAGMVMYEPQFLDVLLSEAHKHEVICIADEVFTGFGRTGKWFACEYLTETVDIIAVSKGITGGTLPLGVTACCKKVEDAFKYSNPLKTFFHGHSYTANPIACAAANASYELLMHPDCMKNIQRIAGHHTRFIESIRYHRMVKNARSTGTILAIELDTGEGTSYFNTIKKVIYDYFLDRDILLRPLGNIIYILPPYVIEDRDLEKIYATIRDFLALLASESDIKVAGLS